MKAAPRLVLASASPRRRDLLAEAGIAFEVAAPEVDEAFEAGRPGAGVLEVAIAHALRKALAAAARERAPARILAADTIVVAPDDGELLAKAADAAEARRMIERLSGRTHEVVTGVAIVDASLGTARTRAVASEVRFRTLAPAEIEGYISGSLLWRGKAGAYGVQDRPSLVAEVGGSVTNVIGLPMEVVREMLD